MTQTVWKLLPLQTPQDIQLVWRDGDNGKKEFCQVTDQAYLKWLEEGNTPEPADEGQ